jgi:hypothetical protein
LLHSAWVLISSRTGTGATPSRGFFLLAPRSADEVHAPYGRYHNVEPAKMPGSPLYGVSKKTLA